MCFVNFRCKEKSWEDFGMKEILGDCIDEKLKKIYISRSEDPYMQMFLRNYCLRPSCYECVVKKNKLSDITIGDFWGINKVAPEMNDGQGVSIVVVRSKKGTVIMDGVRSNMRMKEVSYKDGIRNNPAEYNSVMKPAQRDIFYSDMVAMDFHTLKEKYIVPEQVSLKTKTKRVLKSVVRPFLEKMRGGQTDSEYRLQFMFYIHN